MANLSSKPVMKPRSLKDGSAWYIELTWPDGQVEHIDSFQSESEINDWIFRKSDAWLNARGNDPTNCYRKNLIVISGGIFSIAF